MSSVFRRLLYTPRSLSNLSQSGSNLSVLAKKITNEGNDDVYLDIMSHPAVDPNGAVNRFTSLTRENLKVAPGYCIDLSAGQILANYVCSVHSLNHLEDMIIYVETDGFDTFEHQVSSPGMFFCMSMRQPGPAPFPVSPYGLVFPNGNQVNLPPGTTFNLSNLGGTFKSPTFGDMKTDSLSVVTPAQSACDCGEIHVPPHKRGRHSDWCKMNTKGVGR